MRAYLAIVGIVVLAAGSPIADEGLHVGTYEDGSTITAESLHESLATLPLMRGSYPLRYLRASKLTPELQGPHIRFANGDVLPGKVIGCVSGLPDAGADKRMVVLVSAPLASASEEAGKLEIRIDRIARIAPENSEHSDAQPGTLWLSDNRPVRFETIKWGEVAFTALTDTDTVRASYEELREYHAKDVDPWDAILEDSAVPGPGPNPEGRLVRFELRNGAVITCRGAEQVASFQAAQPARLLVRPTWAPQGIVFDSDRLVCCSYRHPSEVPLSLLRAATLSERSFTGFLWPWRRNCSVRGTVLRSGSTERAMGIGMHARTAVAFELPPGAREFTSWVGLDQAVGPGGCVTCSIYGDATEGDPLWQSGYLRGSDGPVNVDPVNVEGLKRLILVADFAHEGRPEGADPMDVRDAVNWLGPMVKLAAAPAAKTTRTEAAIPELKGWELPAGARKGPFWHGNTYVMAIYVKAPEEVRFKREFTVSPSNAWLHLAAGRGNVGEGCHRVTVHVDGEVHDTIGYNEITPPNRYPLLTQKRFRDRQWGFGEFAGKNVLLEIVMTPGGEGPAVPGRFGQGEFLPHKQGQDLPEVIFEWIRQGPVVGNMADHGGLIAPVVPVSSLTPCKVALPVPAAGLQAGKVTNGKPLIICTWPFADGYGVPGGTELTYKLDPAWTRFVAIIGWVSDAEGTTPVGPFQLLLDGAVHWESTDPRVFGRRNTARQIDVAIPRGHETITLRIPPGKTYGAWANAGFMVD